MFNRILKLPLNGQNSLFLFGPRGTGKTSWIKSHLKNELYLDLLEISLYSDLIANPGRLESLIPPDFKNWVVIDEVQRVPELLNEVHRLIESKKIRFLLTGSSSRTLKRKGINLLAGRALRYNMHPLVIQEMEDAFNLNHALNFGLLPMAVVSQNPRKYLETYVQTYLREEVLQEGLTRNLGGFAKFLEVASFSQGQVLNFSEISRELGLNRLTVANYFDILEDLLLSVRIPVFSYRAKRKIITHEKFYFFDCGVYRAVRPTGPLDSIEEAEGVALETLFLQSLLAINDYYELGYKIYFWRTHTGNEVDFVVYGPKGFHAFEVKRSSQLTSTAFKGLRTFKEDYPEAKLHILFLGKRKEYHEDITAWPIEDILKALPEILSS